MIGLIRDWIAQIQTQYISPVDRRRALSLMAMNGLIVLVMSLSFIGRDLLPSLVEESLTIGRVLPVVVTFVLIGVIQRLLLGGSLRYASLLFLIMVTVGVLLPKLQGISGTSAVTYMLPVVTAGVLLQRRDFLIAVVVVLVAVGFAAIAQGQANAIVTYSPARVVLDDLGIVLLSIVTGTIFLLVFGGTADAIAEAYLEHDERLEWLVELRDKLGKASDENEVLVLVSELITAQLLYTFAQTHLNDSEGRLNTYKRTGMGTRHAVTRAEMDIDNAVRVAGRNRETVVASSEDLYEKRSHLLPSVNFAAALPLVAQNQYVGVLDVQSNADRSPFNESELRFLRLVAAELAYALVHVRQRNELQQALGEQQRLNDRLQGDLTKLRRDTQQESGSEWARYLHSRRSQVFGFDASGQNFNLTPASDLPAHLREAMFQGEMVIESNGREQIINLPILRRDEILGAMSFVVPGTHPLNDRQIEMARSVSNRLAVALENVQLVEQSRAQASRERKAGEIASVLLGQQEVNRLLETAAESFQEALGAIYTRIYIEPDVLREEAR